MASHKSSHKHFYRRLNKKKDRIIRENEKPFNFCCSKEDYDPLAKYDQQKPPFPSAIRGKTSNHECPVLRIRSQFTGPISEPMAARYPKIKNNRYQQVHVSSKTIQKPIRWYLEDAIAVAKNPIWTKRQEVYNKAADRNILISKKRVKDHFKKLHSFGPPRWYQDFSLSQIENVTNLDKTLLADFEENVTTRTQAVLSTVGIISPFVKISSAVIHRLLKESNLKPVDFLYRLYREVTGNYFVDEGYKNFYDCNERIILSAIAFLTLPETFVELHKRLPPIKEPKIPPKPKPPKSEPIVKKSSPYLEKLFTPLSLKEYKKQLFLWKEHCKLIPRPRVLLPPLEFNSKSSDKNDTRNLNQEGPDPQNSGSSRQLNWNEQKMLFQKNQESNKSGKKESKILKTNPSTNRTTGFSVEEIQKDGSNKFEFTISANSEAAEYQISGVLKPGNPPSASQQRKNIANYVISGISSDANPPELPLPYELNGRTLNDTSEENFYPELKLGDGPGKIYPEGRENLSRKWQDFLHELDEEYLKLEKEANKLVESIGASMRLIFPKATCDNCCSCRQTRKSNLKWHGTKTPYMVVESIVEDKDRNRYLVGSVALHSPAESPVESSMNLLGLMSSYDKLEKKLLINGVTNNQGETTYFISGITNDLRHIPREVIRNSMEENSPARNVPPCRCAIEEIFEPDLSEESDPIPCSKPEDDPLSCYAKKFRPREAPAYSCQQYEKIRAIQAGNFETKIDCGCEVENRLENCSDSSEENSVNEGAEIVCEDNDNQINGEEIENLEKIDINRDDKKYIKENNNKKKNSKYDDNRRNMEKNRKISQKKNSISDKQNWRSRNCDQILGKVHCYGNSKIQKGSRKITKEFNINYNRPKASGNSSKTRNQNISAKEVGEHIFENPKDVENTGNPEHPENPTNFKNVESLEKPGNSDNSGNPKTPENSENPEDPEDPQDSNPPTGKRKRVPRSSVKSTKKLKKNEDPPKILEPINCEVEKSLGPFGCKTQSEENLPVEKTIAYLTNPDPVLRTVPVRPGGRACKCRENRNTTKKLLYTIGSIVDPLQKKFSKKKAMLPLIEGVFYVTPPPSPRRSEEYIPEYVLAQSRYGICSKSGDQPHPVDGDIENYLYPSREEKKPKTCSRIGESRKNYSSQEASFTQEEEWQRALQNRQLVDHFSKPGETSKKLEVVKPVCECQYERKVVKKRERRRKFLEREERLKNYKKTASINVSETHRPMQIDTKLILSGVKRVPKSDRGMEESGEEEEQPEEEDEVKYCISGVAENFAMGPVRYVVSGVTLHTPVVTPEPSKSSIPCRCDHRHWSVMKIPGDVEIKGEGSGIPIEGSQDLRNTSSKGVPKIMSSEFPRKRDIQEGKKRNAEKKNQDGNERNSGPSKKRQPKSSDGEERDSPVKEKKSSGLVDSVGGRNFSKMEKIRSSMGVEEKKQKLSASRDNGEEAKGVDPDAEANRERGDRNKRPSQLNSERMMKIVEEEIRKMATEGFLFAKLPESHAIPQVQYWILYRNGVAYSKRDKERSMEETVTNWNLMKGLNLDKSLEPPSMDISQEEMKQLTYARAFELKQKVEAKKSLFYSNLRKLRVLNARYIWPSMEYGKFPSRSFKEAFFTYLPSKETDTFVFKPWQRSENLQESRIY